MTDMSDFPALFLSRRQFLLGAALGAVSLSLPEWLATQAFAQTAPRVRYEASSTQGKAMLAIYRDGVKRMKALPRHDPRSWQFQANIHAHPDTEPVAAIFSAAQGKTAAAKAVIARNRKMALGGPGQAPLWNTCPHGTTDANQYFDHFVSWHRMYVLFLERTIASLTNKPNFALPYWEYSHPGAAARGLLKLPAAFLTPAATSNALWHRDRNPRVVSRGLTAGAVGPRFAFDEPALLPHPAGEGFNSVVDGTPHGNVHVAIGTTRVINGERQQVGMASIELAARDPIFWVHHANVDRMWESWRRPRPNGTSPLDPPAASAWSRQAFSFVDPTDPAKRVTMTAADVFVTGSAKLGYKYDTLASVADATSFASAARAPTELSAKERVAQAEIKSLDEAVTVPVNPTVSPDVVRGFSDRPDAGFELKIDVEATDEPGGLYEVFVIAPKTFGSSETMEHLVGTFNLFGLAKHKRHTAPGGKLSRTWRADITDLVLRKLVDPSKPAQVVFRAAFNAPTVPVTVKNVAIEAR